jgi:3-oxoacyl-[acyl-carrier protein] reductase
LNNVKNANVIYYGDCEYIKERVMSEKTVIITGSSRGIGLAAAYKFGVNGYTVVINSRNAGDLARAGKEMSASGINVLFYAADVSDYSEVSEMFEFIRHKTGSLDVLVNNAGISRAGLFQDMKDCDFHQILGCNLFSVLNCSHKAIPLLLSNGGGSIINISSIWGEKGASCEAVYSASKGGVNSFTKALAKELGPSNIRVNAISCGFINTDMNSGFSAEERKNIVENISLLREGQAEDIAETAFFLAGERAGYITGQIVGVDGGWV